MKHKKHKVDLTSRESIIDYILGKTKRYRKEKAGYLAPQCLQGLVESYECEIEHEAIDRAVKEIGLRLSGALVALSYVMSPASPVEFKASSAEVHAIAMSLVHSHLCYCMPKDIEYITWKRDMIWHSTADMITKDLAEEGLIDPDFYDAYLVRSKTRREAYGKASSGKYLREFPHDMPEGCTCSICWPPADSFEFRMQAKRKERAAAKEADQAAKGEANE